MVTKKDDDYDYNHSDESRMVYLGDITEETVKETIEKLVSLSENDTRHPIYMIVNTYGGDIDECFALYDVMRFIPAPVITVGLGKIMSAGALLLAAGKKGKRQLGKNSRIMYHAAWSNITGNVWEQKTWHDELQRQQEQYDELFAAETGLTIDDIQALYAVERVDRFILPDEALKMGIVDKVF